MSRDVDNDLIIWCEKKNCNIHLSIVAGVNINSLSLYYLAMYIYNKSYFH